MTGRAPSITVLVSGEGTNLQALIDAVTAGRIAGEIGCVLSDRAAAPALARARRAGIPAHHVPVARTRLPGYDAAMAAALRASAPDLVVLAGYMRLLSPELADSLWGRALNLHPSLLPRHRGLDTHRRVLEAGDAEHGATVHFVRAELDAGPSVLQYRLRVSQGDTVASLSARVHRGEYIILPRAVDWFCAGRLRLDGHHAMLDGQRLEQPVVVEETS